MAGGILVVDDDPCIRELMQLHLRRAGYRVRLAKDALIAGRMLLDDHPELLIVDVDLPYMSGQEFVATLVADQTIPHLPVLFLTADETFEPKAMALGADVLTKPCRADVLITCVERKLAENRRAQERYASGAKTRSVTNRTIDGVFA
jgi:DNA-binding response OmpR family regulator